MDFCNTKCMFCNNPGIRPINYSNYHKICFIHLEKIDSPTYKACIHCNSLVIFINDIINCRICNLKNCICASQNNKCPGCNKGFISLPNQANRYCLSCQSNVYKCQNCGKFEFLITLKCSHMGCFNCKDENLCKACCASYGTDCPNCNNFSMTKIKRSCQHTACEICIEGVCKECILGDPLYSEPCVSCGGSKKDVLGCGHEGCSSCYKNKCSRCLDVKRSQPIVICQTCEKSCFISETRECLHISCENCLQNPCLACKNQESKKFCQYCQTPKDKLTKIQCNHEICDKCLTENIIQFENNIIKCMNCYKIPIEKPSKLERFSKALSRISFNTSKIKCCSCQSKTKNLQQISCEHFMCERCTNLSKPCEICPLNSQSCSYCYAGSDFFLLECQHPICRMCFEGKYYCKRCNIKKCYQCKERKAYAVGNCGHDLCEVCIKKAPKCLGCIKSNKIFCPNCGENQNECKIFLCEHQGCDICITNTLCYKCTRNKKNKIVIDEVNEECSFCKIIGKRCIYLRCSHAVCRDCLVVLGKKLRVLNYSCPFCIQESRFTDQICSICHNSTIWVVRDEYFVKSCCGKKLCKKCFTTIKEFEHKCNSCLVF